MDLDPHDADSADSRLGFTGLTAFGPAVGRSPDESRLAPGTLVGDVTITRFLAEGGMGCVYEARQGIPARTVAVKVLRPGSLSPAAARRFLHEAHVLGRLSHPGIARIYSVGMHQTPDAALPCFVMEYVEGGTPVTVDAEARRLTLRERVGLFRDVCQAVAHGHQRAVIHRDLKPSNILVDANGRPKVIDFGVARCTDGDAALTTMHTAVGQFVGTLHYMSPEQFDEAADDVDVRADVYSLGVVLHELLVGRLPYDLIGKPVHRVASFVREVEPRRIGLLDRRLRGDLETIVATCLEKDRTRRYSSAAELEADLGRWLDGEPISAARPGLAESLARLARRHRAAAAAAAAVAVAVLAGTAGIAIFAIQANQARRQSLELAREAAEGREVARQQRDRADAEAGQAKRLLAIANLRSIQSALGEGNRQAARRLIADTAAVVPGDLPLELRCLAAEVDDATDVITAAGPVFAVGYSPDGNALGIRARSTPDADLTRRRPGLGIVSQLQPDSGVEVVTVHELSSRRDRFSRSAEAWALAWPVTGHSVPAGRNPGGFLAMSANGTRALAFGDQSTIEIVEPASSRRLATLEGAAGRQLTACFSSDGSRVATCDRRGRMKLWNAEDGRVLAQPDDERTRIRPVAFSGDAKRLVAVVSSVGTTPRLPDEVLVLDADGGDVAVTITLPPECRVGQMHVAVNHDGSRLATGTRAGEVDLWDAGTGALVGRLAPLRSAVESLAFADDGRRLAAGSADGRIVVWDVEKRTVVRELVGHDEAVSALAFHPDGDQLASGSLDGTARLWRMTGPPRLSELAVASAATAAAFSPDAQLVAIGCEENGRVEVWHVATAERIALLDGGAGRTSALGWSPDGRLLAAGFRSADGHGETHVWRLDAPDSAARLPSIPRGVLGLAFTPDGTRLLATAGDGSVLAYEASSGRWLWASPDANATPRDGLTAVLVRGGGGVAYGPPHLIDTTTGGVLMPIRDTGRVTRLAASPDGGLLASGMAMGTVYLTTTNDGMPLARLDGHGDAVKAIAFAPDGRSLASGSLDGTARIWSCDGSTAELTVLGGHGNAVEAVSFSPDGRRLLTASTDGTVRLWDPTIDRLLCTLPAPRTVGIAAISPDGRVLLAGTAGGGLRLWGLSDAEITAARRSADGAIVGGTGQAAAPRRLLEGLEERPEVGEVLAVETEGPEVR